MTYREKLQKEHPEKVNEKFIGGCIGCPSGAGYGPENIINYGCIPNEAKCTACWNKVIPGTEEREYENLSRDELITLVKLLEGRIDTKSEVITRYTTACTDKNTEIKNLKEQIAKLEQKNETYSNLCAIYKSKDAIIEKQEKEIERRGKLLDERDNEIENYKKQVSELAIENTAAAEKIEELEQQLDKNNEVYRDRIKEKDREITILKDIANDRDAKFKECQMKLAVYRSQSMQTYGTCCCKPDVIAEKDKEIERLKKDLKVRRFNEDFWYDEFLRLSKKVGELVNSNQELKDALEEEKKEHAKHHSLFGKYFAD